MNPRTKRNLQKWLAIGLYSTGILVAVLFFVPFQYPDWWPRSSQIPPVVDVPWMPPLIGIDPAPHYFARFFLTMALGLTIFLPQVETTFTSLMRRQSPIGTPYVDSRNFMCRSCGRVNRPDAQFCVRCGSPVGGGTRYWGRYRQNWISLLKFLLAVMATSAFFLGLFDLTIFYAVTARIGLGSGAVVLATLISATPSLAGYVALKEGAFRKYSSLRQFDKLVYGNSAWPVFGVIFLSLAALSFSASLRLFGSILDFWIQLLGGFLLASYPLLRKRAT